MAEIYSIVYKPREVEQHPRQQYARLPLQSATLVVGQGIEGDVKGGHPKRQLNIMSYETLAALHELGLQTEPGQMGEQIIVKGLDVGALQPGEHLQLGGAWVEVIEPRTGCDRFESIQQIEPKTLAGKLGIIARVVSGGTIAVGDPVAVGEPG